MSKSETADKVVVTETFLSEASTLLILKPVNENGHLRALEITVHRGALERDKEGDIVKLNRFAVDAPDGFTPDAVQFYGTSAVAALKSMFRKINYGTVDDYTFNTDAEFFTSGFKSNASTNDIWSGANAGDLIELRKTAEAAYLAAEGAEGDAQEAWLGASQVLQEAFETVGEKHYKKWAQGGEHANDAPMLARLGQGKNALSEARRLAQLTNMQYAVLPSTMTRGKTIDLFMSDTLHIVMSKVAAVVSTDEDCQGGYDKDVNGNAIASADQYDVAAREVILYLCDEAGVELPAFEKLREGLDVAIDILADIRAKHVAEYRKSDEGAAARKSAARVMGFDYAIQLAEASLTDEKNARKAAADVVKGKMDKGNAETFKKARDRGLFVKRLTAELVAIDTSEAKDARSRSASDAADDAKGFETGKDFKKRGAMDVAAQLWNTFRTHPAYAEIYQNLGIMVSEQRSADADERREQVEASKAEAAKRKAA